MIDRWVFLPARLLAAAIFIATWAYGVTTFSPFAFDMFIRPQLLPELATFVIWHHAWYWGAYLLAVLSLAPDLRQRRDAVWWASIGFVIVFGGIGLYLTSTPVLAMLTSGSRSTLVVPGALLPIAWLALIDHLACGVPSPRDRSDTGSDDAHLLAAACASAATVWLAHQVPAWWASDPGASAWLMTAGWALVLDLAIAIALYAMLVLVASIAALRRRRFATEYVLAVLLIAAGITALGSQIILPAFAFSPVDAATISGAFGATIALMWSGLRVRVAPTGGDTPWRYLLSPASSRIGALVWLAAILATARLATTAIAQIDWASILHTTIALAEAILVLGVFLELLPGADGRVASWRRIVLAPLAALIVLYAMPFVSARLANATNDPRLAASAILDRLPAHDPLASFAATRLIEQDGFDIAFYQDVIATEHRQSTLKPEPRHTATPLTLPALPSGATLPNILFIVVDSLRRDYLSPYNAAVTFTPEIEAWARESFVFRNAFTPYGGTWLAMPSIWTGTALTRGWGQVFDRINALQALITGGNYEFVINDFTVAGILTAPRTFLDPEIPSLETDLCRNLQSLRRHTENRAPGSRPLFVYLAPMNIHILNTQGGQRGSRYRGFYEPYAARVERIDRCFGEFIAHYRRQGLYDNSIIVLTSDHGDLLGEDGRWGHQFHLFPQAIRIPMIVRLPTRWQHAYTTDLARISFLTDLAPSLLALLGGAPPAPEGVAGAPLFVPTDQSPAPRRRESFMVMSSYGSTYGLLRRNGKFLYISDLLNWRDHAYELFREPNGERVPVTAAVRRVNQSAIERQLDRVDQMFKRE